ncbi:hypothetical protein [Alkaliphilus oremlandii]|uniref:Uncharacterized protein n=1 Tax=Alkaliphilus oremlandii (strain OhILAs) TaxID=350688 RepID=A8MHV8_ALKOO|nr:hypothetical protein [Alkaliphilus oremlandii]ABW19390.1 hypothetical protein Clos_1850 [Alkaliphilus oremlandii OhILAs]
MESYVEDILVKHHCHTCRNDFILSEYQIENSEKEIMCPYCHGIIVKTYIKCGDDSEIFDILGCMSIGHHMDIEEERISYERIWEKIIELKIDNLEKEIEKLKRCKGKYR